MESYQSPSPSVSSVTLIEHSPLVPLPPPVGAVPPTNPRRSDTTKLNVGRNRYHSSKLGRGVNRRREKLENEPMTARHSEIHIDDSGEV